MAIDDAPDGGGRDTVAHEMLGASGGPSPMQGQDHVQGTEPCPLNQPANNQLMGYTLDDFGIFSVYDENGPELMPISPSATTAPAWCPGTATR